MKDLDVMSKIITFLEENTGIILCDLRLGIGFLDMMSKAEVTKKSRSIRFYQYLKLLSFKGHH